MQLTPLNITDKEKVAAILIKESAAKPSSVLAGYYNYFSSPEVADSISVAPLYYAPNGKVSVGDAKSYLQELLPMLYVNGIKYLYVADSTYFKILSGEKKADPWRGYAVPCVLKGFEEFTVVLGYNYNVLFHNPTYEPHIITTISALEASFLGESLERTQFNYTEHRVTDLDQIDYIDWLSFLLAQPKLSLDIEALSLKFYNAGVATASFAWSTSEAVTFNIDMHEVNGVNYIARSYWGFKLLEDVLRQYTGTLVYHNGSYDIKVLIYEIFMQKDFFNYTGMIEGLNKLTDNFDDTKLITYCATNNAVANKLSLKEAAHEYVGNYALDEIKDVTQIELGKLLNYNGVDAVATFWLYEKNYPIMVADQQESVYQTILKPSVKLFLQAELVGIPIDMDRVLEAIEICEADKASAIAKIMDNPLMKDYAELKAVQAFDSQHERWKKKRETIEFFRKEFEFNPNSPQQVADFLYEYIGFEAQEFTDTGAPSTSKDALEPLKYQTDDPTMLEVLKGLEELSEVATILSNFLTTFRDESILKEDGNYWLHGSFNIGGTKSGRLSSSEPNMQNLPAKGKYGKLVKSCVVAPKGWLLVGADFNALEDRIDALLTKDTNKLKVYTDGYDSHCLRTAYYYSEYLTHIDISDVKSVNSIKETHDSLRTDSKPITFALTYMGTDFTLIKNCGLTKQKAKEVVESYKLLYRESEQYKMERLSQAAEDGYATLAFGLRIRCKILSKSMFGTKYMSSAAKGEMRTIGNAFGQSFGMLNNRAGIAFQDTCLNHTEYSQLVLPIMHIHDAQYFLIQDDIDVIEFCNNNIAKEMSWQELPEIQHDLVKLGGELDIFVPSWAEKITIPNYASKEDILLLGDTIGL